MSRKRGRRAAPRRTPAARWGSIRRLLPQALVVATLAGGTAVFIAEDKTVRLDVDGTTRTLHTYADDVAELLADEGVPVGRHDQVTPALERPLTSGDRVTVSYGRPVALTVDGSRRQVWTTARTVDGVLYRLGVRADGARLSTSRSAAVARRGLDLEVRTERSVTVRADGRVHRLRTTAATVRQAVRQAGLTLRGEDSTSVPEDDVPRDGQSISVLRIVRTQRTLDRPIRYRTVRRTDPTVTRGTETVRKKGRPGIRRVTYLVRTVNGVSDRPRTLRSEVIKRPVSRVVSVGTRPKHRKVPGTAGLNWRALAHCESGGRPGAVDPSGRHGGLYQFDLRTWHSVGGRGRPQDAAATEQTYRAKKLYVSRGASPWPRCGHKLHR